MERRRRLFETEKVGGRAAYRFQAVTVAAGILLLLYYRVTHVPAAGEGRAAWLGMLAAEFWFSVYWVITQSVRWCPVRRRTFKDRLAQRYGEELPGVDIFVCTADPQSEPPSLVISTILSVMAYNYPSEKISVYLSDDGGSILTFYALWEASKFAKHWLPFCKRYNIEPRSPAAYFFNSEGHHDRCPPKELSFIKDLYEEMTNRIDTTVINYLKDHQPIVQILIDGKGQNAVDDDGNVLPTLVYMAREKRPQYHHNFKAGAMNALIRVSSVISDNPIILNVDCDMYSNNSDSIRDALCFFLDEEMGHNIGFVQYPQNYNNETENNIYGNSLQVLNQVEIAGLDSVGGPPYIGTGCFHRREVLCGRIFSKDYKEDWNRGIRKRHEQTYMRLKRRQSLSKGTPLFPEIMNPWATPFIYVFCMKNIYCLYEELLCGHTLKGWWNGQRMWMVRRITSYLYGLIDTIRKLLGLSKVEFVVSSKVILCGMLVIINIPIYEAMFLRKDKARIPFTVTLASIGFVILAFLIPIV
ncbi:hypothetical protein GUJ93_ZPchr0009g795 [Zizania palustris]|uniref:Cellulose synthase-like protein E6 n=1 Tax=Zizania palustris TaxID=103762 RepID=A0A8J5S2R2_ZIZPA|nr:hypothetical protein GUJ93_ZPchr0009g795 [Zizania palustris]